MPDVERADTSGMGVDLLFFWAVAGILMALLVTVAVRRGIAGESREYRDPADQPLWFWGVAEVKVARVPVESDLARLGKALGQPVRVQERSRSASEV